jgi:hypothetical protein
LSLQHPKNNIVRRTWETTMKRAMQLLTGSVLFSLAPLASAEHDADPAALRIASAFVKLAGSEDNIMALVCALREGAPVHLVSPIDPGADFMPEIVVIEPPTGEMGWNDVKMALMLSRDALQRYNIVRPTLVQLHAALLGGDILTPAGTTATLRGVLQMRADGINWGRIAAERYRRDEIVR